MCVESCGDFAYNYIENHETKTCSYCGPTCTLCSPKYGCLEDHKWDKLGYKYKLGSEYPSGEFPYSASAPSTEFRTTQACSDERCMSCQNIDAEVPADSTTGYPQCDACFKYINFYEDAKQELLNCDLCVPDDVDNCLICDPDNPQTCLSCQTDFYLDKDLNECLACGEAFTEAQGCKRCDGTGTSCLECLPGHFQVIDADTGVITCLACDLDEFNSAYILEPNRCSQCVSEAELTTCKYCDIGFMGSTSNPDSCELKCDDGQYPVVTYEEINDNESLIQSTLCQSCDQSCATCMGPGSNQCLSCPRFDDGTGSYMYLAIQNIDMQSGTCNARNHLEDGAASPQFDIYVSNATPTSSLPFQSQQLQDSLTVGSLTNPFYQLEDALLRAKELAGLYVPSVTVQVTIHLFRGTHYALDSRGGSTLPYYVRTQYLSGDNLNYELTVKPLMCSENTTLDSDTECFDTQTSSTTVTVLNKRRERLRFDVPVKLTLSGVIIDGTDSILHSLSDKPSCLGERETCCSLNESTGEMENEDADLDASACQQAFEALFETMETDCFANWPRSMFKMRLVDGNGDVSAPNELILSDYAGIKNTFYAMNSLVAFTSAGGIVTASSAHFSHLHLCGSLIKDSYADLGAPDVSSYVSEQFLSQAQLATLEAIQGYQATYGGKSQIEYYMDTVTESTICDSLDYCTQVLIEEESTFQDIPFGKAVQAEAQLVSNENGLRNQGYIVTLDSGNWSSLEVFDSRFLRVKAPFDSCSPYESLVAIDDSRVQPAASLDNFRQLFNPSSEFNQAQVSGSFVLREHRGPVVFSGNTFSENISYSGAISVEQIEGIFWAQSNSFQKNVALQNANAIDLTLGSELVDGSTDNTKQCGGINIDSNTFELNIGCQDTTGAVSVQCVGEDAWSYNSIMDVYTFASGTQMPVFTAKLSSVSLSTTVSGDSQVQQTLQADYVSISDNNFSYNFAGTDTSIISIVGFQSVVYQNNVHYMNENWIVDSYRLVSPLYKQRSDQTNVVERSTLTDIQTRARSIVYLRGLSELDATGCEYEMNFVLDNHSPYSRGDATIQSNGILIEDLVGSLDLSESNFTGNKGINANNRAGILPEPDGFSSRLIAFHRCTFDSLTMNDMTFESNTGAQEIDTQIEQQAQLFSLEQSLFASDSQQMIMNNLHLKNNQIYNSGSLITFQLQNLYMEDLFLNANQGDSIILFEYLNDRVITHLETPYIASNKVAKGSALRMEEHTDFRIINGQEVTGNNGMGFYHFKVFNGQFKANSVVGVTDSTESGPRTSCLEAIGTHESWAYIYIGGTSTVLDNNRGVLTNEIYVDESVAKLELRGVKWTSEIDQISETQMAQVIYKPPNNSFQLRVTLSKFLCTKQDYDREIIMENQLARAKGRAGLFRLGESENVAVLPILDKDQTSRTSLYPNGYLDPEEFNLVFEDNEYQGCNQVEKGAIFYLEEGARLYDEGSEYYKCSALQGGLAYLTGHGTYLKIYEPDTTITKIYAYQGGAFYIEKGATVEMESLKIKFCQAYEGTIAFVNDRSRVIAHREIYFQQNKVHRRGLFLVTDGSQIYIDDSDISYNDVGLDSAVIHAENNRVEYHVVEDTHPEDTFIQSWLENSSVTRNEIENQGRVLSVIESNLTVTSVQFKFNDVGSVNYGVYVTYAELILDKCTFIGPTDSYMHYDMDNEEYKDVSGAFLQVQEESKVLVKDTNFNGGRGIYGGCILMQGYSRLLIEDSVFDTCTAQYGGAIYANSHLSLHIYRSTFERNFAFIGYGQNVYSSNAVEQLRIEDSTFESYHNSIYTSGYMVLLKGTTIKSNDDQASLSSFLNYRSDGGGLYIEQTAKVVIQDSRFENLKGRYGGAIYIYQDRLTTTSLTKGLGFTTLRVYLLEDVKFTNCSSEFDGGAIYAKNPLRMTIKDATFTGNVAKRYGGAIDYVCEPSDKEFSVDPDSPCDFEMENIDFNDNEAIVGGAIKWNLMEMKVPGNPELVKIEKVVEIADQDEKEQEVVVQEEVVQLGSLRFKRNKAAEYGPQVASVARELIKFSSMESYLNYYNGTIEERQQILPLSERSEFFNNYIYTDVQSGGMVPTIFLGLIDKYGQLVTTNRGSEINFRLKTQDDVTEITGVTNFYSAYGTFNMSGMGLLTQPDSEIMISLIVSGIDMTVPSNAAYLNQMLGVENESQTYTLHMEMQVRPCILGEGLRESGACYECPENTYLLQAPTTPQDCRRCDNETTYCLGGKMVGPKPGYWRLSGMSYQFFQCPESDQCLGMDITKSFDYPGNANGLCDTENGHYGVMCTACLPGFKKSGQFSCAECTSSEMIRVVIIVVSMVVGLCVMVKYALKGAVKGSEQSVFNKILMNHAQMLIITADFEMSWPDQVIVIFSIASPIREITEAIVNFDCFMDTRVYEDVDQFDFKLPQDEVRVYAQKIFIMAMLPIILALFAYVIWWLICRITSTMETFKEKFIATLVFILFLVHPSLTKRLVDVFNCRDYDGQQRLVNDLQVRCYEDPQHAMVAYYVAIPGLIVWGLGIPVTVLAMMRKEEDKLETDKVKQQYGFLYNGYKRHNYYWEIVIMYRKILCIFIATFLRSQGVVVQALVLLIMLGVFLQANNTNRPFKVRQLNDIENMSVATQIITIYCGIFFISAKERTEDFDDNTDFELTEQNKVILVMVIAASNAFFILLWLMKFMEISREMIKEKCPNVYIFVFLCGRWDKLRKESVKRAGVIKREKIISSIEDTVLFLKKMKKIYSNNVFYEDHDRFLTMLYEVESVMRSLDMTEKRNNFYIQGNMARHRKFDRERIKELANEQILELEAEVVQVMEEQRDQDNDRLRSTPFFQSQKRTRNAKPVDAEEEEKKKRMRMRSLYTMKSQATVFLSQPSQGWEENSSPGTPAYLSLGQAKSLDGRKQSFRINRMDSRMSGMMSHMSEAASAMPNDPAKDIVTGGAHPSIGVDLASVGSDNNSQANVLEQPQMSMPSPMLFNPRQSIQFQDVVDDEYGDEDDEYGDQEACEDGKKTGGPGTAGGKKGDSKARKKDIYLDNVIDRSRNAASNVINAEKRNFTVGKLQNRDQQKPVGAASVDRILIESLHKQLFVKPKDDKDDPLMEPSHIQDYVAVEALDAHQENLHLIRQLTNRAEIRRGDDATAQKGQLDSQSDGNALASGSSLASQPLDQPNIVGVANLDSDQEKRAEIGQLDLPSSATSAIKSTVGQEPPAPDPQLAGSVKELSEDEAADEEKYEVLRPRNVPRRALIGNQILDQFLDHSDSFIEEKDSSLKLPGAPDKEVLEEDPFKTDREEQEGDVGQLTPREEAKVEYLEIEDSPLSKFSIQMSPAKGEKLPPEPPEKPINYQKPSRRTIDHGMLTIEMVDDAMDNIYKMPKYRPPAIMNYGDDSLSPKKSPMSTEQELKVHDGSRTDDSSTIKTDSSMKDYDYMIEPEIKYNFNIQPYRKLEKQESGSVGDGLGVLTRFKGQSALYDLSESEAGDSAPDKSSGESQDRAQKRRSLKIADFDAVQQ